MKVMHSLYRNMHAFKNICLQGFINISFLTWHWSSSMCILGSRDSMFTYRKYVYIQEICPKEDSWRLRNFGSLLQFVVVIPQSLALAEIAFTFCSRAFFFCSLPCRVFLGVTVLLSSVFYFKEDRESRLIQRKDVIPCCMATNCF